MQVSLLLTGDFVHEKPRVWGWPTTALWPAAYFCTQSVTRQKDPHSFMGGLGLLSDHDRRAGLQPQRLCGSAKLKAFSGPLRRSLQSPGLCDPRKLYPVEPSCADKTHVLPTLLEERWSMTRQVQCGMREGTAGHRVPRRANGIKKGFTRYRTTLSAGLHS